MAAQPRYTACNGTQRTRYYVWSTPKVPSLPPTALTCALHYTGLCVRVRVSGCASVSARAEVRVCAPMRMRAYAYARLCVRLSSCMRANLCRQKRSRGMSRHWLQMCIGGVSLPLSSAVDCAPCNVGEQRRDGVCTVCADG